MRGARGTRHPAAEISRGQGQSQKYHHEGEGEGRQIDRARLELKHLLSEAEDATKTWRRERAEKAGLGSGLRLCAALLAARTARCKASISATKFDLEQSASSGKSPAVNREVERCDQLRRMLLGKVKAAGAFEALIGDRRHCWI